MNQPSKIIDIHAFYDENRLNIKDLLILMDGYNVRQVVLSPACLYDESPKSEFMLNIQRILLWNNYLRIIAHILSKTFYDKEGKVRYLWRLFTQGHKPYIKVMHPDNDTLEDQIKIDKNRLKMWYWINPNDNISISTLKIKLLNKQILGLKFHPPWHNCKVKDLSPYLQFCEENNVPVYIQLGFGETGDYKYLLEKHTNNTIIFGYGGFPYYKELWKAINNNKKIFIDFTSNHINKHMIKSALKLLGPQRCLYGSECPYNFLDTDGHFDYNLTFARLDIDYLSSDDLEDIFSHNYTKYISR